jgi:hypothetical protein
MYDSIGIRKVDTSAGYSAKVRFDDPVRCRVFGRQFLGMNFILHKSYAYSSLGSTITGFVAWEGGSWKVVTNKPA